MARAGRAPYLGAGLAAHASLAVPELVGTASGHIGANVGSGNTPPMPLDPFAPPNPVTGHFIEFSGAYNSLTFTDAAGNVYKIIRSAQQCPPGSQWDVTRFAITDGAAPFTFVGTHTGDGWVFAAGSDSDYTIAGLRDIVAQMPSVAFYNLGQFVVYSGQRVVFLLENGTATNYGFNGTALQRPSGVELPVER